VLRFRLRVNDFIKVIVGMAAAWPIAARAQTYPSRPITMVVPFAAGGGFDVMGRLLAARMSEILGQQVKLRRWGIRSSGLVRKYSFNRDMPPRELELRNVVAKYPSPGSSTANDRWHLGFKP